MISSPVHKEIPSTAAVIFYYSLVWSWVIWECRYIIADLYFWRLVVPYQRFKSNRKIKKQRKAVEKIYGKVIWGTKEDK